MKCVTFAARLSAAACTALVFALTSQPDVSQSLAQQAEMLDARLPLLFEQNIGQVNAQAEFLARSGRYQVYLAHNTAILRIAGKDQDAVLRISPRNANQDAKAIGLDQQRARTNYLVGPSRDWKTGIAN